MNASLIDLHMHSTASDGTDDIPQLLENVRAAGIRTFSVTDHDTINGAMEMESIVPTDMRFIRGIEFSCISQAGKCHILGYGYDRNASEFKDILEEGSRKRRNKLHKRLIFLQENFGITISENELEEHFSGKSIGKPHLGNWLVSMGMAANKDEAIGKYINPCKTESCRLDAGKVIKAILASGGIPVWAHPYGGTGERELSRQEFDRQLQVLLDARLAGLECYYSIYSEERAESLAVTAKEHHLVISGGSDYHGKNKTVALGVLNAERKSISWEQLTICEKLTEKKG